MSLVFRRESIDKFFEQWQDSDPEGLVKGLRRVDGLPEDNVQALINILWAALAPENSALRQRLAARFDEDAFTEDELRKLTTELCIAYDRLPYAVVLDGVRANVSASIYVTHLQREVEGTFKKKTITLISPRLDVVPHEREGITLRDVRRAAIVWMTLYHVHILPLLGVSLDGPRSICMVLPPIKHRALDRIKTWRGELRADVDQRFIHSLMYQVASGLSYLHDNSVVHGDLRCDNVTIDESGRVRLAGSLTATHLLSWNMRFYFHWLAPEILDPNILGVEISNSSDRRTFASDIYAFACTCIELYTLAKPFAALNDTAFHTIVGKISQEHTRPPRPTLPGGDPMPDELWKLLTECWARLPRDRPAASTVLEQVSRVYSEGGVLPSPPVSPPDTVAQQRSRSWRALRKFCM